MSRIGPAFERLAGEGRKALIPFVMAGDPDPQRTVPLLHAMVDAGADILELGVPFSDPMADGPVIQRAGERALKHNVGLEDVLAMVTRFRANDARTPLVLMGYANPIEALGVEAFVREAKAAGVDGVIVVDYPPEESGELAQLLRANDIDLVFLLAPTSTDERIELVSRLASGYLYYVSLRGVTGASHMDVQEVASRLAAIRAKTRLPVGVGFGIRDAGTARAVCAFADAVIIGSRLIQEIETAAHEASAKIGAFLREVRQAMDQGAGR
jgi:tryptophan synthase alpha chain